MDLEAFRKDPKMIAAVERMLSIISEAAVRLDDQADLSGFDMSRLALEQDSRRRELAAASISKDRSGSYLGHGS